jgi:hypothetical protein
VSGEPQKPKRAWLLSREDKDFLRSNHISAHDICRTCKGMGCDDCRQTGEIVPVKKRTHEKDTDDGA